MVDIEDKTRSHRPLIVQLDPPLVAGDTVAFSWQQSEPNSLQSENSFYIRYENIELEKFPASLFYEIFFSYQLQILQFYQRPVVLRCSTPVWQEGFQFWQRYHRAHLVVLEANGGFSPSPAESLPAPRPEVACKSAVLYGGGKDSTCMAALLGEVVGTDQTLLINFIEPRRTNSANAMAYIEKRREKQLLGPMREIGFPTQMVWTDFLAIQRPEHRQNLLTHYHFYLSGALPLFLERGISIATIGNERSDYRVTVDPFSGKPEFRYARSRPEFLHTLNRHLQRLGCNTRLTNFNYIFTGLMAAKLLATRYPDAFARILMCMKASDGARWCYQCMKCGNYAFYSLYCGYADPRFDYDQLFAKSEYVNNVLANASQSDELLGHGNRAWQKRFSYSDHFEQFCHVIANIDPAMIADRLGDKAMQNLLTLKEYFGNRDFAESEVIYQPAIDSLSHITDRSILDQIVAIASEYFPITNGPQEPFWLGNETATFDFRFIMPLPNRETNQRST